MEQFDSLKETVAAAEVDVQKWAAGNKAAGTRVRKAMQQIKKICQEVRGAVLADRGETPSL